MDIFCNLKLFQVLEVRVRKRVVECTVISVSGLNKPNNHVAISITRLLTHKQTNKQPQLPRCLSIRHIQSQRLTCCHSYCFWILFNLATLVFCSQGFKEYFSI